MRKEMTLCRVARDLGKRKTQVAQETNTRGSGLPSNTGQVIALGHDIDASGCKTEEAFKQDLDAMQCL